MTATKNEDIFLFYMNKIVLFLKKRTDRTVGRYLNCSIFLSRKNGKPMDSVVKNHIQTKFRRREKVFKQKASGSRSKIMSAQNLYYD